MTHRQQLIGICTSPIDTFDQLARTQVKHSLWILPLVFMIIVSLLSNILLKSNPAIQSSIRESSMRVLEQQLDQAIERGSMTAEQKEKYMREIEARLSHEEPARFVSQSVVISITLIFNIFIAAYVFFVCAKYVLGGNGKFINALIAYTMPLYILMLKTIVIAGLSTLTGIALSGTNLAGLVHAHDPTIGGFLLSKIDPFLIWFYCVVGIGCAKMFGSDRLMSSIGMTLAVWLGSGILVFYAARVFPVLRWILSI